MKLLAQKGDAGWRELFLSKMGIESETRKMGRKPLTKGEKDLALVRLKAMYYSVISELEEEVAPVLQAYGSRNRVAEACPRCCAACPGRDFS